MTPRILTATRIRESAYEFGFDFCRIVAVRPEHVHAEYMRQWLASGCHGEMDYLARHQELRFHPEQLTDSEGQSIRSIVVLGVDYHQTELPPEVKADPSRGLIARYAWQRDYHEVLQPRLHALDQEIRRCSGRKGRAKCWVDTGPVVERDWALAAGLTFTGKNCCSIHPQRGSWLLLAVLCIPEDGLEEAPPVRDRVLLETPAAILAGLPGDLNLGSWTLQVNEGSAAAGTCGRCTRCLDACPTDAFSGPLMLDARKCISYWTIEAHGAAPRALRSQFGNRIFGCDICQDVCPWNRELDPPPAPRIPELTAQPQWMAPYLLDGFKSDFPYWLSDEAFRAHFRKSPVKRAKRSGMLRNVCTALGNWGSTEAVSALSQAVLDSSSSVRQHAVWALENVWTRTRSESIRSLLQQCRGVEVDAEVQEELALALG